MSDMLRSACLVSSLLLGTPVAAQCELPEPLLSFGDGDFSGNEILVTTWSGTDGPLAHFDERGPQGWSPTDTFDVGLFQVFFTFPVSFDGDRAIVGGPEAVPDLSGRAYVFERTGGSWSQIELAASNGRADEWFGSAVDVCGDVAVVGAIHARGSGALGDGLSRAYVFERLGGVWTEVLELPVIGYGFGKAVAVDGDTIAVGRHWHSPGPPSQSGIVYVFEKVGGAWTQVQTLEALAPGNHELFGAALELGGDTLVVGAPNRDLQGAGPGFVEVFERDGSGAWFRTAGLQPLDSAPWDGFGRSLSLSGSTLLVGAPQKEIDGQQHRGAVYRFERGPSGWTEVDRLTRGGGFRFGETVACEGNRALLGDSSFQRFYSLGIGRSRNYCVANPNSTGLPADVEARGCDSRSGNRLELVARQLPPGRVGLFLFGLGKVQVPFGDGFRCVGPGARRFPLRPVDGSGELVEDVDFTLPRATSITAGTTWFFQAWYTDPAAGGSGFNLSGGLALLVEP